MDRLQKGTAGKPVFSVGDTVGFYIKLDEDSTDVFCKGEVKAVDAFGVLFDDPEPYYDIVVDKFLGTTRVLFKHIAESSCCMPEEK